MFPRVMRTVFFIGITIVALSGCIYRMDILQGNRIDESLVRQLEIGMSRNQVQFLLGSPAVSDLYRPDVWNYVYYKKTGEDGSVAKAKMVLKFKGELLKSIDGSLDPS